MTPRTLFILTFAVASLQPSAAIAQVRWPDLGSRVTAGLSHGFPVDLYSGAIRFNTIGDEGFLEPRSTRYRERLRDPKEVWAAFTLPLFEEHYLRLRARRGTAASTATYEGGGIRRVELGRDVSWWGLEVAGGAVLLSGMRYRGSALGVRPSIAYSSAEGGSYGGAHRDQAPTFTVGLRWRLGGAPAPDPGLRAVEAIRARAQGAEAAEPGGSIPSLPRAAARALAVGDTAAAIEVLRRAAHEHRDDAAL